MSKTLTSQRQASPTLKVIRAKFMEAIFTMTNLRSFNTKTLKTYGTKNLKLLAMKYFKRFTSKTLVL